MPPKKSTHNNQETTAKKGVAKKPTATATKPQQCGSAPAAEQNTKKNDAQTYNIPRKRNIGDNDPNPSPTKLSKPRHIFDKNKSWSTKGYWEQMHQFDVYIPKLIEKNIFASIIKRHCDNSPAYSKPLKDLYKDDPDKALQLLQLLGLGQCRDRSVPLSLNKPVPRTSKGDFYEEANICYRADGQSDEEFYDFFCKALTTFANKSDSGFFGCDNKFSYKPEDDVDVEKPINAILRDKPTMLCCKKLYWEPGMTKQQMVDENPDILVKFWGSPELGYAMLDKYDEEQWKRLV